MFEKMGEYANRLCVSLPEFFSIDVEKTSTGCCDVLLAITRQMEIFKANQKERQMRSNFKKIFTLLTKRIVNKIFPENVNAPKKESNPPSRTPSSRPRRATKQVDLTATISAPKRKRKNPPSSIFRPVVRKRRRLARSRQEKKTLNQEKAATYSSSSSSEEEEDEL